MNHSEHCSDDSSSWKMSGKCYFLIVFQKIAKTVAISVNLFLWCLFKNIRQANDSPRRNFACLIQKFLFVNNIRKSYNQVVCFELDVVLPWMLYYKLFDIFLLCFFWSFLLCFIYKSINQTFFYFELDWLIFFIFCVLILHCFCFVYVFVLLFASSGKLENQKNCSH